MNETKQRRSALKIMGSLIGLVKPLIHIMLLAIILGTAGYLCAIFLTILASKALAPGLADMGLIPASGGAMAAGTIFVLLVVLAVARGLLHYAEQYCNHFIAFKLLAIIRHEVFAALRKLCPAKLEGKDKGDLITLITTDIELLEVFYAHTISPICIAVLTCLIMIIFFGSMSIPAAVLALLGYLTVGVLLPVWNGKRGGSTGMEYRTEFADLSSFVLENLRGLDETIRYDCGGDRVEKMEARTKSLSGKQKKLSGMEGATSALTNLTILVFSFLMFFLCMFQYEAGSMDFGGMLLCTVAMMGSFGPTVALSALSNNLNQTLACGERVLSILEETPMVEENPDDGTSAFNGAADFTGAEAENVTFAYGDGEVILQDFSMKLKPGRIIGIHGPSGCGKSTFLKLLMRFWDIEQGSIKVCGEEVKTIPTKRLRDAEGYVTQETHLFHDSIANNIAIGKQGATREEIIEAAKKASVHDFIMKLPEGYDTEVGELGDTLSGGEKQRIGLARVFLHGAPFILLDEPTSNLDSLNEGIILKSLYEEREGRTVLLVSHRLSTLGVADEVYTMNTGRLS